MIRLVIADDHHLIRQGLRQLLSKERDFQVVAEAADGREAVDAVIRLLPDVVVMDIEMPGMSGIEATDRVRRSHSGTQVVMLSVYSDPTLVNKALENGARGYVLKQSVSEELVEAIRTVYRGMTYWSGDVELLKVDSGKLSPVALPTLTSREHEILRHIATGQTNPQIAKMLSISVKTVENHRVNLMAKLDAHSLPELIRSAIKQNLIGLRY